MKLRHFYLASPWLSMGASVVVTSLLVALFTLLLQCHQGREGAVKRPSPPSLSQQPSVTDSGFEASYRAMPTQGQRGSPAPDPMRSTFPRHPAAAALSAVKPCEPRVTSSPTAFLAAPQLIQFDSRFYQDFEPVKCLGESWGNSG